MPRLVRRRTAALIAGSLLPALLATPAFAAHAPAGAQTLTGTVRSLHGDAYHGAERAMVDEHLEVVTARGSVRVALPDDSEVRPGQRVSLQGSYRSNGTFVASDGGVRVAGMDPQALRPFSGTKRVAVVMMNFSNNQVRPYTKAAVRGMVFDNADSTAEFYEDASDGQVHIEGDVFGWVTIPHTNADCAVWDWANAAMDEANVDPDDYDNLVFTFPSARSCPWWGLGTLPGPWSWVNGTPLTQVVAHELGHNYGVHHANGLHCYDANDVPVTLSNDCTSFEYHDNFSVMGGSTRLHHNWHRVQLGYMESTQTASTSGDYQLAASELDDTNAPRLLRVARGDGTYFQLEFRTAHGIFDDFGAGAPARTGISIRIAPGPGTIVQSQLLDCTPSTMTFDDAPCGVGDTFVDPVSGYQITATAVSAQVATISVQLTADEQAPSVPNGVQAKAKGARTVDISWSAASDNVRVKGYRVYRNNALIGTTKNRKFVDTHAAPATTYSYTVAAYDAAGNASARSAAAVAKTAKADVKAPSKPKGVKAYSYAGVVVVMWNASTDDVGVAGYRVFRNGATAANKSSTSTVDIPGSGSYTYTLSAYDAAGNVSGRSQAVRVNL